MAWTKVKQQEKYLKCYDDNGNSKIIGALYKDHLITLKDQLIGKENMLCCFNLRKHFLSQS